MRAVRASGVTIIELMIVLAVVGMLAMIGYMSVQYLTQGKLREDSTEVAALLRGAHNWAVESGKHHRMMIDIEKGVFWLEVCEDMQMLSLTDNETAINPFEAEKNASSDEQGPIDLDRIATDQNIPPEMLHAQNPDEVMKVAEAISGKQLGPTRCGPASGITGDAEGRDAMRQLEGNVKFRRVFVQHLEEPAVDGLVTINFFPLGHAEKAIVELVDDGDNQQSLLVHGLTSRIEFVMGELDDPDDHMMRKASGDKVDDR